jgi:hypothetical protein
MDVLRTREFAQADGAEVGVPPSVATADDAEMAYDSGLSERAPGWPSQPIFGARLPTATVERT